MLTTLPSHWAQHRPTALNCVVSLSSCLPQVLEKALVQASMKAEQLLHRLGAAADASGAMGLEFGRLAKFEEAEVAVRVCCAESHSAIPDLPANACIMGKPSPCV